MKEHAKVAVVMIVAGAMVLATFVLTSRINRIDQKLDEMQEQIAVLQTHTCTDASTDIEKEVATPTEPEEVSIELRDGLECPSEPQEDIEEVEVAQEATTEVEAEEKASESTSEEVYAEISTEEFVVIESEPNPQPEPVGGELEYAGIFELTAYTWTGNPCANGNYPTAGYTVASNYFSLGTRIYIEGYGEYVVEDTGGMASNVIDIYLEDYNSCIEFGRKQAGVYVVY